METLINKLPGCKMKQVSHFLLWAVFLLPAQHLLAQNMQSQHTATSNKLLPVLWHQHAAEYRALCYQAFNLAELRLASINVKKHKRPLAIITDIDETVLDNSYSEAQSIKTNAEYNSANWKNWTSKAAATPLPGAVAFFQKAKQMGFHIFYISNRDTSDVNITLKNLQAYQFPDVSADHLLFLSNESSKEARRQKVAEQYEVVMLLGDNLNDFAKMFEKKNIADRFAETDAVQAEWGRKFLVLPNAIYGEWESALIQYKRGLNSAQKDSAYKVQLKGY
ncbi:MAG: 5'-nucleotidase, lipoprotein e(P4) family [Bacteroidetes bacterium]|nr:5'-nucleotidase, lipoprotein e(P4) family [Bacteroidota bacterium]